MNTFDEGLRCQDVHSGLRNLDPNSPVLAPLTETQKIGMAAGLASLIKGQDVVVDAQALRTVAAEQLDVSPYAFNDVVYSLEQAGFVSNIQTSGSRIISFNEEVPYYRGMYEGLGEAWRDNAPSALEQQVVALVDGLAAGELTDAGVAEVGVGRDEIDLVEIERRILGRCGHR